MRICDGWDIQNRSDKTVYEKQEATVRIEVKAFMKAAFTSKRASCIEGVDAKAQSHFDNECDPRVSYTTMWIANSFTFPRLIMHVR